MTVTITSEERDALYERIVTRLSGIDDVYRAVEEEDWETAQALGQEFSDLLGLICTDLGWGDSAEETFDLSTHPKALSRAARVLRELAQVDRTHHEGESREAEEGADEARYLQQTCERLLGS
jgi:hypothetical protein